MCADNARTKIIGQSTEHKQLLQAAEEAFKAAYKIIGPGTTTGDIGYNINHTVLKYGFNKLNEEYKLVALEKVSGHGIGLSLHEDPAIPNTGYSGAGTQLLPGMCICIEPVVLYSSSKIIEYVDPIYGILQLKTSDNRPSSHFENQIFITDNGPILLTK